MPSVSIPRSRIADGSLPSVCIVCGEQANSRYFPRVTSPSLAWVLDAPLFGLLTFWAHVMLPGSVGSGEEGLPFCKRHRAYWPRRAWFIIPGFVMLVLSCLLAWALDPRDQPGKPHEVHWSFGVVACWMLVFLPAFLFLQLLSMRPTSNSRTSVRFAGIHPAFVEALEDEDEDAEE